MYERQRAKADQRIRDAAAPRLEPGETVRTGFTALSRIVWLWLALPIFPVVFWLEYTGRGGPTPLVLGAWIGLVYMFVVRTHFVVLTDRRLLVLRLRRLSSKVVSDEWEARGERSYRDGFLSGFLTLDVGHKLSLQIPAAFKDRARSVAAESPGGAQPA